MLEWSQPGALHARQRTLTHQHMACVGVDAVPVAEAVDESPAAPARMSVCCLHHEASSYLLHPLHPLGRRRRPQEASHVHLLAVVDGGLVRHQQAMKNFVSYEDRASKDVGDLPVHLPLLPPKRLHKDALFLKVVGAAQKGNAGAR